MPVPALAVAETLASTEFFFKVTTGLIDFFDTFFFGLTTTEEAISGGIAGIGGAISGIKTI